MRPNQGKLSGLLGSFSPGYALIWPTYCARGTLKTCVRAAVGWLCVCACVQMCVYVYVLCWDGGAVTHISVRIGLSRFRDFNVVVKFY